LAQLFRGFESAPLDVRLHVVEIRRPSEFEGGLAALVKGQVDALATYDDAMFVA
jgi:hypothetical protein